METFKNTLCFALAGVTLLFIIVLAGEPSKFSWDDERNAACVSEQYNLLLGLTDKPWRTGELVAEARKLCRSIHP